MKLIFASLFIFSELQLEPKLLFKCSMREIISLFILIAFHWPNIGLCQSFGQKDTSNVFAAKLLKNNKSKENIRTQLKQKYENQTQKSGELLRFEPKETQASQRKQISGGTWTGGGGSGLACTKDKEIQSVVLLDTLENYEAHPFISVNSGETSIDYIRRVLKIYSKYIPLFSSQVLNFSEVMYQELQEQLKYESRASNQLTFRDYSFDFNEARYPLNCDIRQLATRYAEISFGHVENFFIDYDVALIEKMHQTAKNENEGVLQEASLILHEALYLMSSTLGENKASYTTFMLVPLFLHQWTIDKVQNMNRSQGAKYLREILRRWNMGNYHIIGSSNTETWKSMYRNHYVAGAEVLVTTDNAGKRVLVGEFGDVKDDRTAFLALASVFDSYGKYVFDDLFMEQFDQKLVINEFCQTIKRHEADLKLDNGHMPSRVERVYKRALNYCD